MPKSTFEKCSGKKKQNYTEKKYSVKPFVTKKPTIKKVIKCKMKETNVKKVIVRLWHLHFEERHFYVIELFVPVRILFKMFKHALRNISIAMNLEVFYF